MSNAYILVAGDGRVASLLAVAGGAEITAVVVGPRELADVVASSGVSAVSWLGDPGDAPLESYANSVAEFVAVGEPSMVLASTRPADRVLAGAVAARLAAPVFTMVSQLRLGEGAVELTRSVFGGIAQETITVTGPVVVVGDGGGLGEGATVAVTDVEATPADSIKVLEERPAARAQVDLGRAQRIVSVGRGLKAQADVAMLESLADALGAEIACSRPMAEGVGWFSHDRYVGVTGQHVTPELYLAVGISGQLQHTVGARGAATIVAVNSDKNCPYFKEADYCVVGDLYEIVPAVIAALK